jgi:Tol biopolymer transport system component
MIVGGCSTRSIEVDRTGTIFPPTTIKSTTTPLAIISPTRLPNTTTPSKSVSSTANSTCPDNSWDILTTAQQNSIAQVFLVNSQTGETNQLTHGKQPNLAMGWSPDGCEILLLSRAANTQEYSSIARLDLATLSTAHIASVKDLGAFPKWSPDGSLIAITKAIDNVDQILTMDANGRNIRQVTSGNLPAIFLEWSPDSQMVAYALRSADGVQEDIHLINLRDGKSTELPIVPGRKWEVHWSPDGRKIVFFSGDIDAGTGTMYILRIKDRKLTGITQNTLLFENAWSSDSRQIAFSAKYLLGDQDDVSRLYAVDSESYKIERFGTYTSTEYLAQPSFSQDGKRFAFRVSFSLAVLYFRDRIVKLLDNVPEGPDPIYWRPVHN